MAGIVSVANFALTLVILAIIARAILSWFYPLGKDRWSTLLLELTEPILGPIRSVLSRILPIPIDFSPIVAIILLNILQNLLVSAYGG